MTVLPERDAAVFAGVHAVRSVEATGTTRWEVRHGCWYGGCTLLHGLRGPASGHLWKLADEN
ncbi:hypothetical protein ACGFX8_33185 [Streptomyces sp. NPDC048362]|uniref:hypothetical protein n=1 Tax=Streptomyces sp. NPDC048362 TaxID=3365539 RepID=UPI003723E8FC